MREVYHFSEDPAISRFVPHVPRTNPTQPARVYAIDADADALWLGTEGGLTRLPRAASGS